MKESDAKLVGIALMNAGFDFAATLPATQLHTLQTWLASDTRFTSVPVTNEGEGVAICAGAWMSGRMPVIVMETSGLLVATYALMRCHTTFGVPTLLLSTYRGGIGDQEWYAVHTGAVIPALLPTLRIPAKIISRIEDLETTILDARRSMDASLGPVSVVLDVRLTNQQA